MNLPNKLTLLRIALILPFLLVLYLDVPYAPYIALAIFIAASLTDMLDGKIARKRGLVTDFGKFADPLADKMLVTAAMLWFVEIGRMPGWEDQDRVHHGMHRADVPAHTGRGEHGVRRGHRRNDHLFRRGVLLEKQGLPQRHVAGRRAPGMGKPGGAFAFGTLRGKRTAEKVQICPFPHLKAK